MDHRKPPRSPADNVDSEPSKRSTVNIMDHRKPPRSPADNVNSEPSKCSTVNIMDHCKPPRSPADDVNSGNVNEPPKKKVRVDRIDGLFQKYANKSSGFIEERGINRLCKDLFVDPKEIKMLIFAWTMKAKKPGIISKNEWQRGLKFLGVDGMEDLWKEIDAIRLEMIRPGHYESFYSYVYQYKVIDNCLDIETACELLNVVLKLVFNTKVDQLVKFLKIQEAYNGINEEEWKSFYRFFREVKYPLSFASTQSSKSEPWPAIIDSFVEWLKENQEE